MIAWEDRARSLRIALIGFRTEPDPFVRWSGTRTKIILALIVFDTHQPKQLVTPLDQRPFSDRSESVTI
jgi:hypothetical protein